MKFTIASYVETLQNCAGRFNALAGVVPVKNPADEPCISLSSTGRVTFLLDWKGQRYFASAIEPPYDLRKKIMSACRTTTIQNNKYIAPAHYFVEEMLLFDCGGQANHVDLVLQPYHEQMHDILRKNAFLSVRNAEREMLNGLAAMAKDMELNGTAHGRLNARSLRFDQNLSPVLLDYPFANTDSGQINDNMFLLRAAIIVFLVGCDARLYIIMRERDSLGSRTFNLCRKDILAAAEYYHIDALEQAIKLTEAPNNSVAVNDVMRALGQTAFQSLDLLVNLLHERLGHSPKEPLIPQRPQTDSEQSNAMTLDFAECEFVGDMCDGLYRFKLNERWGYADRKGAILTNGLLYAQDFYESRAAVKTANGFGLMDSAGSMVMKDDFEDLSWCGQYGVAIAMKEGVWCMYDRNGKPLSAGFDWMDDCCEGIAVVERNHRFGYIDHKGLPITELRYSYAGRFNNGEAVVELNAVKYSIDTNGTRLKKHI